APGTDGPDGATILFAMFRKRWILLFVIAAASAGLAFLFALQFGGHSAIIKSVLIYTGLPISTSPGQFESLGPSTGAEMITSVPIMKKLADRQGLGIAPARMGQL